MFPWKCHVASHLQSVVTGLAVLCISWYESQVIKGVTWTWCDTYVPTRTAFWFAETWAAGILFWRLRWSDALQMTWENEKLFVRSSPCCCLNDDCCLAEAKPRRSHRCLDVQISQNKQKFSWFSSSFASLKCWFKQMNNVKLSLSAKIVLLFCFDVVRVALQRRGVAFLLAGAPPSHTPAASDHQLKHTWSPLHLLPHWFDSWTWYMVTLHFITFCAPPLLPPCLLHPCL